MEMTLVKSLLLISILFRRIFFAISANVDRSVWETNIHKPTTTICWGAWKIWQTKRKGNLAVVFSKVVKSTLLYLPPLRFHCSGWSEDAGIEPRMLGSLSVDAGIKGKFGLSCATIPLSWSFFLNPVSFPLSYSAHYFLFGLFPNYAPPPPPPPPRVRRFRLPIFFALNPKTNPQFLA